MKTEGPAGAGAAPLLAAPPLAMPSLSAPARRGKLPPSPASTFMRPQQQLQRQQAAERAAVQQDAAALAQLLGGSSRRDRGPMAEASEQSLQAQAPHATGTQHSAAPYVEVTTGSGSLTSATLQALLVQPVGGLQQGSPEPALLAEPSLLSSYIAGIEEDSRLVQRQMTHLQASTSGIGASAGRAAGWAGVGALPPTLRGARGMPGRREVFVLSKWLEVRRTGSQRWAPLRGERGRLDSVRPPLDVMQQADRTHQHATAAAPAVAPSPPPRSRCMPPTPPG